MHETLTTRRSTFKPLKGTLKHFSWPHKSKVDSTIHPDVLSLSGFFHAPVATDPASSTRTECFSCSLVVADWNEGDSVHDRHGSRCPSAVFARCRAEWEHKKLVAKPKKPWHWGENSRDWPRANWLRKAREESFEIGWKVKPGFPSAQEYAAAGWFFRPGHDAGGSDCCVCPYCRRQVEGWEADDIPEALHKRKDGLKCPFFTVPQPADFEEPVLSDDDAAPAEEEEADEELQEEEEDDDGGIRLVESSPDKGPDPVAHKRASRTGGKQSVASSAKGLPTSKSRGKLKVQEEESVAGDEVVDEPQQSQTRSRAGSVSQAQLEQQRTTRRGTNLSAIGNVPSSDAEGAVDVVVPPKTTRASRASKKPDTPAADHPTPATSSAPTTSKSTRSRAGSIVIEVVIPRSSSAKPAKAKAPVLEEAEVEMADVEEEPEPQPEAEMEPVEPEPAPEELEPVEEEEEEEEVAPVKKAKAKGKGGKKRAKNPVVASPTPVDADVFFDEQDPAAPEPPTPAVERPPLVRTITSPSPRLIKSLPSRSSPSSPKLPPPMPALPTPPPASTTNPFVAGGAPLPPPTEEELRLGLGEWYRLVGDRTLRELKGEMDREAVVLQRRFDEGERVLVEMVEEQRGKVAGRGR